MSSVVNPIIMTEYKKREMQLHENDPTIDRKLDTLEFKYKNVTFSAYLVPTLL